MIRTMKLKIINKILSFCCLKKETEDDGFHGIGKLPDDVLISILSFLPTQDFVRASFVSKRWKSLCSSTSPSILDLDFHRFSYHKKPFFKKKKQFFTEFVDRMTLVHQESNLHARELRLVFQIYDYENTSSNNSWMCIELTSDLMGGIPQGIDYLKAYYNGVSLPIRDIKLDLFTVKRCILRFSTSRLNTSLEVLFNGDTRVPNTNLPAPLYDVTRLSLKWPMGLGSYERFGLTCLTGSFPNLKHLSWTPWNM